MNRVRKSSWLSLGSIQMFFLISARLGHASSAKIWCTLLNYGLSLYRHRRHQSPTRFHPWMIATALDPSAYEWWRHVSLSSTCLRIWSSAALFPANATRITPYTALIDCITPSIAPNWNLEALNLSDWTVYLRVTCLGRAELCVSVHHPLNLSLSNDSPFWYWIIYFIS